jgi:hypothetical protein
MNQPLKKLVQVKAKLRATNPSLPNLLSAHGHTIATVLRYPDLESFKDDLRRRQFGVIASVWNVDMRYNPETPERPKAVEVVNAAAELHSWVNSRF